MCLESMRQLSVRKLCDTVFGPRTSLSNAVMFFRVVSVFAGARTKRSQFSLDD